MRSAWTVENNGQDGRLDVNPEAVMWDPHSQSWAAVGSGKNATSKVTFDFDFSRWHNGQMMDMNDVLYSLYFLLEWGTNTGENDRTFDQDFASRAQPSIDTIIGVNQVDEDTIEVYVDYWHFDEGEIASWAGLWPSVPWEITAAMEEMVADGKASFSRTGATSKNIGWLSLIVPNDASVIKEYLEGFKESGFNPNALQENVRYNEGRFDASAQWIEEYDHAVISSGPYYLESYSPESRTIRVSAFEDDSYPFRAGEWSKFEDVQTPKITGIGASRTIQSGMPFEITVDSQSADHITYFLAGADGTVIATESLDAADGASSISIPASVSADLGTGAGSVKIFAISDSVLKPDFYESAFIVTGDGSTLPAPELEEVDFAEERSEMGYLFVIPAAVIVLVLLFMKRRSGKAKVA